MRPIVRSILVFLVLLAAPDAGAADYKLNRAELDRMSTEMRAAFAGLHYFLNPYQTRQLLSLPSDDDRIVWMEKYWKQRDPTPTTPENEMEKEHNIRVKLAKQYYESKKWPGWDKRGEVFIRYGPPNYRGKVWAEVSVRGMEPPGELWFYTRHNMLVSFQNFGLTGEFIYSIDALGPAANFSPELTEFLLYDTNESLSQQIPQQYLEYFTAPPYAPVPVEIIAGAEAGYLLDRARVLDPSIDALMDPDRIEMVPRNVMNMFQQDQIREIANNFEIVLEETPQSYPFNFDRKELPFYFAVDQFRGGEESNRVDISVELPVTIDGSDPSNRDETYHTEVVVWDAEYNELNRRSTDISVRADSDVKQWASLIPSLLTIGLKQGYYRLGISVRGETSGHESSYRTSFSTRPFGFSLSISDILFARNIQETTRASMFTRGALEVVPHPVRAYSRTVPMPIYFELYNLTLDRRGITSFTLEYRIISHSGKKEDFFDQFENSNPVVSSRFESSGVDEHEIQHLFVNLENLRKGSYDFLITLTDDNTQQTVFQKGTFSLID